MLVNDVKLSKDDLWIVLCALERYYDLVHPDNSSKKDVERLVKTFNELYDNSIIDTGLQRGMYEKLSRI